MARVDEFDKSMEFKKQCKPLLDELELKCSLNKIPFFWTACVSNNNEKSVYENYAVATGSRGIKLKDDHIVKHIAVYNGFDVVPHRDVLEINMDEISSIPETMIDLSDVSEDDLKDIEIK